MWDQLRRALRVRLAPNHNLGHLRQFLREEWARIPPTEYHNTCKKKSVSLYIKERRRAEIAFQQMINLFTIVDFTNVPTQPLHLV